MQSKTTFQLIISKVNEALFRGAAVSITVPGIDGELTILANHEPFITLLARGTITVRTDDAEPRMFAIEKGVLEASNGQVTLLV